jgi:hypothetical protein
MVCGGKCKNKFLFLQSFLILSLAIRTHDRLSLSKDVSLFKKILRVLPRCTSPLFFLSYSKKNL